MKVNLSEIPTTPPSDVDRDALEEKTKKYHREIAEYQRKLYAEGKHSLLVVFQGMDASGKSGIVRETFSRVNPLGVRVFTFKRPTELEFAHDFLWRVHDRVPDQGRIHVFDRSHYEDVLIQRVHHWIDEERVFQRFKHINNFEELLIEENKTTILKFYLHISKEEQLERLDDRKKIHSKRWKYNANDYEERKHWEAYMAAYESVFENCSKAAEWNIIPTDKNWYKEYLVAKKICETFERLNPQYPDIIIEE